jgi:hypothetical protein
MRVSDPAVKRNPVRQRSGADRDPGPAERREAFLSRLVRMSAEERVRAARYRFAPWQRQLWVGRYPDEAPLVNGEYEWIALGLADLD